ncbi:tachylectin-related carbohydrate-binding protein [Streptomyces hydrogenans]|uniref:tachylectin-related carbohydrate-binding protein n=1 Tax=Streptomyces hydrogenans TaxID=1873719 RepID=UPI0036434C52
MAEGGMLAVIYGITPDGDLQWYRHVGWEDGTNRWTTGEGGEYVSGGWNIYRTVFCGGGGVIYGITPGGDLQWYRHDGWTDGSNRWTAGAGGKNVGGGWNIYSTVLSAGGGVIYGITPGGDLHWYRHDGWTDGSNRWTAGAGGKNVGGGWSFYSTVLSAGRGVIYGITPGGDLHWYRHDGWTDGSARWTGGAKWKVGSGWEEYRTVFSGSFGVIYGIMPEGDLWWNRHGGWSGPTEQDWYVSSVEDAVSRGWDSYNTVLSDTAYLVGDLSPATIPTVEHVIVSTPTPLPPPPGLPDHLIGTGAGGAGAPWPTDFQVPVGKLDPNDPNVITYERKTFDANGVLRVEKGLVAAGTPVPVGPLHLPRESFSYKHTFVDESGALRARAGDITVTADLRLQIGIVKFEGSVDGETLTATGYAEVVTVRVDGQASFGAPGAGGSAVGHAVGPNAHMSGEAGPNGVGGEIGLSAGEIGGQLGVTIGGQPFGVGGEIGLKAELGLHWAATSTLKLPLITISGPNPLAGVTSFAVSAVSDLVRDPVRTAEQAISDIAGVGVDAVEEVHQIVESIAGIFEDDDDHTVTNDVPQGNRGNY